MRLNCDVETLLNLACIIIVSSIPIACVTKSDDRFYF